MLRTKFRPLAHAKRTKVGKQFFGSIALAFGLLSFGLPAKSAILFNNALDPNGAQTYWCDPCAIGHPNAGYQVWDTFTLAADLTLTSLRYLGLRTDPLTLGVNVHIAAAPYGPALFSAHYADEFINRFDSGISASVRTVSLPNVQLSAGLYWLSVYGPSTTEQHLWLAQVLANGDNSLVQFGPDPTNPKFVIPRFMDARFRLDGEVTVTPIPGALVLFVTGFGFLLAFFRRGGSQPA